LKDTIVSKEIEMAKEHFGKVISKQLERIERMKSAGGWTDYGKIDRIIIGIVGGDGIGPYIGEHAKKILEFLLKDEIKKDKEEI